MIWKTFLTLLLNLTGAEIEIDFSTIFARVKDGERDKWAGGPSPCLNRLVRPTDNLIAHRELPCGTKVELTNLRTGEKTVSYVGERGPYGACTYPGWDKWQANSFAPAPCPPGYWRVKKRESGRGEWRGSFDLTPRVGRALEHSGIELVALRVLPAKPKRPRRLRKLVSSRRKAQRGPAQVARR